MSRIAALLSVLCLDGVAEGQCFVDRFLPPVATSDSRFGGSLVVAGDTALVSHRGYAGRRRVFEYRRVGGIWSLGATLDAGVAWGSTFGLAFDGSTVMIGSPHELDEAGRVYVAELTGGAFVPTQELRPLVNFVGAAFGSAVIVEGDRAVIAARLDATHAYRGGAVFVFERQPGGPWLQTKRIDPPVANSYAFFGHAIALEGDVLAVGSPGLFGGWGPTQPVHIYRFHAGDWFLETELPPESPGFGGFGISLALDQGRLVVGAHDALADADFTRGVVYVYERFVTGWTMVQRITDPVPGGRYLGRTVALSGDTLIATSASDGLGGPGLVRRFERQNGRFELVERIAPPVTDDEGFGSSVAIAGPHLLLGAPQEVVFPPIGSGSSQRHGAFYVYPARSLARTYCPQPVANSTGRIGRLVALDCLSPIAGSVGLRARDLPTHSIGMVLVGAAATSLPGSGGSLGVLCLGGGVGRFPAAATGASGELTVAIDPLALPLGGGSVAVAAGQTWRFQCWYRDVGFPPVTRWTDALALEVR